jgi:hypothetical protein
MREPLREDVIDNGEGQIMQIMDEIDQEARELDATAAQWLDLYYWQHHTLQWGLDRSEAWSILGQRWMPLIDAHLISAAWSRPTKEKSLAQMSSEITTVLSPALSGLPYDKEFNLAPKQLAIQSVFDLLRHSGLFPYYRRARIEIQNRRASATPAGPKALLDLWDLVFHQSSAPAWPAVVSKAVLDTWLRTDTGSPQLWYLASIELFARAHALL